MKLGYLVPEFPSQTHTFFWREIAALRQRGVAVTLISTRRPLNRLMAHGWAAEAMAETRYLAPLPPVALAAALPRAVGATVSGLGPRAIPGERGWYLKNAALHVPFARKLVRIARDEGLDHIHVHSCARAAFVAMLARRMGGPSYSLTLHGALRDYGPGQRYKWRDAAFATVITEKLRAELPRDLAGIDLPEILIQPMGVDTDRFARETPYVPPRRGAPLRLFSCGRLNPVKGHQTLIAAVAELVRRGHDVRLEIAGEDEQGGAGFHRDLDRLIADAGLGDRVTLCGAIGEDAVLAKLRAAHIFVLASRSEPLGVAYMEAMSCEVPVIGTDAGGVPELVTHGRDGLLVPPGDPDVIVTAIESLMDDPDMAARIGRAGRETVVARFGAARGAETLIDAIARHATP